MCSRKGLLKKILAVSSAAVMTVSAAGTVWAADTYQSVEKAAISGLAQDLAEYLGKESGEVQNLQETGYKADITLKLEDGGKTLLGLLAPVDVSWVDTLTMAMDVSVKDGVEGVNADILFNDSKLCSFLAFIDMMNGIEYAQIPELADSYLKVSLTQETVDAMEASQESLKIIGNLYDDPLAVIPEGETVKALLERYGHIIVDHMQEAASSEETVAVDGIEEACTVYEGQMYEEDVLAAAEEILNTAKEDAQIKEVLDKWSELDEESDDLYTQFQDAVDSGLAGLAENTGEEPDTGTYICSRIYVNGDGKIVGRDFSVEGETDSAVSVSWKQPSDGDKVGFYLEMATNTEYYDVETTEDSVEIVTNTLNIAGSGENIDGLLNGTYTLAADGVDAAAIEVRDYNLADAEAGYPNGSVTLAFLADPETEDGTYYNPLANLKLGLNFNSDQAADKSEIVLSVSSADVPIISLSVSAEPGSGVEIPDFSTLSSVYDINSQEDMDAYTQELNMDTIKENAINAGVPEDIIAQIEEILTAPSYEETEITDDGVNE